MPKHTKSQTNTVVSFQWMLEQLVASKLIEQRNLESPVSPARVSVLSHLMSEGPKTLTLLAKYRKVAAPTMSRLVSAMVEQGLILQASSKKDKRSKIFIITSKGRALVDNNARIISQRLHLAITELSESEQHNLQNSIELINKVIVNANNNANDKKG